MVFEIPKPKKLDTPIQTVHTFKGGSLDGQAHSATVHYDLTGVILTIKDEQYKYIGNDAFEFIGRTQRMKFQKTSWLQRAKFRLVKFLFT